MSAYEHGSMRRSSRFAALFEAVAFDARARTAVRQLAMYKALYTASRFLMELKS